MNDNPPISGVIMEWQFLTLLGLNLILAVAVFAGKNWLKASIETSMKHKFDVQIENIRAELHKNEELFKSELRDKEIKISKLQDVVLSVRTSRQSLLDKRRLEAVERLWTCLIAMAPYKAACDLMAKIDFEDAVVKTRKDENLRKWAKIFIDGVEKNATTSWSSGLVSKIEQPFVSPLAWAYFIAYLAVITYAVLGVVILGLDIEVENADKMNDNEIIRNLLISALPDKKEFIDGHAANKYHVLLDEIEAKLLEELIGLLEGKDADRDNMARAAEIVKNAESVLIGDKKSIEAAKAIGVDIEALVPR
jgi:hypothetical protein